MKPAHRADRFRLMASGKVVQSGNGEACASGGNIAEIVKLLPKFYEGHPDVFFSLFESIAEDRGWTDSDLAFAEFASVALSCHFP